MGTFAGTLCKLGSVITATEMIKLTSQQRELEMIHLKLVSSSSTSPSVGLMYDGSRCQETKEKRSRRSSVKTTWDEAAAAHGSPGADYGSGGRQRYFHVSKKSGD